MKILITGATGGLGRNACEIALQQGDTVIATGRNQTILNQLKIQGVHQVIATDLAYEPLSVQQLEHVDAIWHCAALSSPWGAYNDFYRANVIVTEQLVNAAGQAGVPYFVHISTPSLYFDYQHHHQILEDYQPKQYVNEYAKTKALAEERVLQAVKRYPKTRYVMLRPRAIFGAYDQVLIPRLQQVIAQRGFLPLPRGGDAIMDFSYAPNVVYAMYCAIQQPVISGSVFNISNQQPFKLRHVIERLLQHHMGLSFKIKTIPYPILAHLAKGMEICSKFTHKEPVLTQYSVGALNFDMTLSPVHAQRYLCYTPLVDMYTAIEQTALYFNKK